MSDDERKGEELEAGGPQDAGGDDEEAASTPFDSPWFLPVLLWPLAAWFGYDGWFNPEMAEHLTFNRAGFVVLVVAAIWYTIGAVRDARRDSESS
jgi:hypothetical protein